MRRLSLVLAAAAVLAGCKDPLGGADGGAPVPSASASAMPSSRVAAPSASASAAPAPKLPLEILKFRFANGLRGKEPKEEITFAEPGQRVWAHLTIRNASREKRTVKVIFRVNGDKRTTLDLDVEPSLSYRTWGYNTLRDGDAGELSVEATDDTGATLVSDKIPIRKAKPGGK